MPCLRRPGVQRVGCRRGPMLRSRRILYSPTYSATQAGDDERHHLLHLHSSAGPLFGDTILGLCYCAQASRRLNSSIVCGMKGRDAVLTAREIRCPSIACSHRCYNHAAAPLHFRHSLTVQRVASSLKRISVGCPGGPYGRKNFLHPESRSGVTQGSSVQLTCLAGYLASCSIH